MTLKGNIVKLYLFNLIGSICLICPVIVPFFTEWGHLNMTQVMVLQSWYLFWVFALQLPTGALADKFGRKFTISLGIIFAILADLVYIISPNFFIFMAAEFLFGLSTSLTMGSEDAILYDTLKSIRRSYESKKVFGRFASFGILGISIGSLISGFVTSKIGLRMTMAITPVFYVLSLFFILLVKEPKAKTHKKRNYFSIMKEGSRKLFSHRILRTIITDFIFISIITYSLYWLYQPFLRNIGFELRDLGIALLLISIGQIIVMMNYEKIERLLGSKKRLVFLTSFFASLCAIISSLSAIISLKILSLVLIVLAIIMGFSRKPLMISYMNKYIPSSERATTLSGVNMMRTFILILLNPIIGKIADWSIIYSLLIIGVIGLIFSISSKIEEAHLID